MPVSQTTSDKNCHDRACPIRFYHTCQDQGLLALNQLLTLGNELIRYNNFPQWASSVLENESPCRLKPVSGGQNVGFPKREPQKVGVTEGGSPAQRPWRLGKFYVLDSISIFGDVCLIPMNVLLCSHGQKCLRP